MPPVPPSGYAPARNLWYRVTLGSKEAALCAPSSSGMYYDVSNQGIEDIVIDHISMGRHDILKHNSFNNTSVYNYITEIVMALSGLLVSFKGDGK